MAKYVKQFSLHAVRVFKIPTRLSDFVVYKTVAKNVELFSLAKNNGIMVNDDLLPSLKIRKILTRNMKVINIGLMYK